MSASIQKAALTNLFVNTKAYTSLFINKVKVWSQAIASLMASMNGKFDQSGIHYSTPNNTGIGLTNHIIYGAANNFSLGHTNVTAFSSSFASSSLVGGKFTFTTQNVATALKSTQSDLGTVTAVLSWAEHFPLKVEQVWTDTGNYNYEYVPTISYQVTTYLVVGFANVVPAGEYEIIGNAIPQYNRYKSFRYMKGTATGNDKFILFSSKSARTGEGVASNDFYVNGEYSYKVGSSTYGTAFFAKGEPNSWVYDLGGGTTFSPSSTPAIVIARGGAKVKSATVSNISPGLNSHSTYSGAVVTASIDATDPSRVSVGATTFIPKKSFTQSFTAKVTLNLEDNTSITLTDVPFSIGSGAVDY